MVNYEELKSLIIMFKKILNIDNIINMKNNSYTNYEIYMKNHGSLFCSNVLLVFI